ncbi:MAG: FHA domain-containing protein [Gammaproteobacteria bacterium]
MAFLQVYCNGELKFKSALNSITTSIGRAADNDVVIDNAGVSGHHARIICEGDVFTLEDNNSTNGVFVNGRRVTRQQLQYGDEIGIFKHKLKFTAADLPLETSMAERPPAIIQSHTVAVDIKQVQALLKEVQEQCAYLLLSDNTRQNHKIVLSKQRYHIGKTDDCDIRVGGWFAPKLAAKIIRQSSGYFLFPEKWGKVRLNGVLLSSPAKLHQGDNIAVRAITLAFYETAFENRSAS